MRKKIIILLLVAILFAGCASKGVTVTTQPVSTKLSNYQTMLINVSSLILGAEEEITKVESMLVTTLRQSENFEKIIGGSVAPDEITDLQLNVKIVKVKKVGSGARAMLGIFDGRAHIVCDVELIDSKDSKKIGAVKAEGKSSGGSVFAKGTDQAIKRATEKIIEFIHQSM